MSAFGGMPRHKVDCMHYSFDGFGTETAIWQYDCNLEICSQSGSMIAISQCDCNLAVQLHLTVRLQSTKCIGNLSFLSAMRATSSFRFTGNLRFPESDLCLPKHGLGVLPWFM
jgi:hypothetical protein